MVFILAIIANIGVVDNRWAASVPLGATTDLVRDVGERGKVSWRPRRSGQKFPKLQNVDAGFKFFDCAELPAVAIAQWAMH